MRRISLRHLFSLRVPWRVSSLGHGLASTGAGTAAAWTLFTLDAPGVLFWLIVFGALLAVALHGYLALQLHNGANTLRTARQDDDPELRSMHIERALATSRRYWRTMVLGHLGLLIVGAMLAVASDL